MKSGQLQPLIRPIVLNQNEIELIRLVIRSYRDHLNILTEPKFNPINHTCSTLLKRLEPYPDMRSC
jgi:hypothetical protein